MKKLNLIFSNEHKNFHILITYSLLLAIMEGTKSYDITMCYRKQSYTKLFIILSSNFTHRK